jgi:hypothetical protein
MNPAVHMQVRHGQDPFWIVALQSGNYTVDLALTSGGAPVRRAYPNDLMVDEPVASGFGWPTTGGSVMTHRVGQTPVGNINGGAYLGPDGKTKTFTR